jgi:hypothetical protein
MIHMTKTAALVLVLGAALTSSAFADSAKITAPQPVHNQQTVSTGFSLKTGAKETKTRTVEGEKVKAEIVHYTMQPYGIVFEVDSNFKPVVTASKNAVTFSRTIATTKQKISVTLQMFKGQTFNQVGNEMQKEFVSLGYKRTGKVELNEKGKLRGTQVNYSGKHQYAGYTLFPVKGGILVVKHIYPWDAGDAMGAFMYQLHASLNVK